MIVSPRVGDRVQAWYRKAVADYFPLHGRIGTVVISGRGKPRNHGILFDGENEMRSIPCGNIRAPQAVAGGPQLELLL